MLSLVTCVHEDYAKFACCKYHWKEGEAMENNSYLWYPFGLWCSRYLDYVLHLNWSNEDYAETLLLTKNLWLFQLIMLHALLRTWTWFSLAHLITMHYGELFESLMAHPRYVCLVGRWCQCPNPTKQNVFCDRNLWPIYSRSQLLTEFVTNKQKFWSKKLAQISIAICDW